MAVFKRPGKSGKYVQACLIGALLIGAALGSPLPQFNEYDDFSNEIDQVTAKLDSKEVIIVDSAATTASTIKAWTTAVSTTTVSPTKKSAASTTTVSPTETSAPSTTSTTTTEYPYKDIAKIFALPTHRQASLSYSSGTHKFNIAPGEDETKRTLEEYNYHFERVEKSLPHTPRPRGSKPAAPSKY